MAETSSTSAQAASATGGNASVQQNDGSQENNGVKNENKETENKIWIYFFTLLFVLEVISYVKFCFDYPFTFTMNFRYIVPTLLTFGTVLGYSSDKNKKLDMINSIVLTLFIVLSLALFVAI